MALSIKMYGRVSDLARSMEYTPRAMFDTFDEFVNEEFANIHQSLEKLKVQGAAVCVE